MIKFKITPERFSEACSILDYVNTLSKNQGTIVRIAPRFIVDENDKYIVAVTLDKEGDIEKLENENEAFALLGKVTPKRLEKLVDEFCEAANAIVNPTPPKAGDSQSEKD